MLTAIGVYGAVAYATARRTREIALRRALGADAGRIVALVVRENAVWTAGGLITGVSGALVLTRYLETLLFRVKPTDAATFAGVAVLLAAVVCAATMVPAIRAMRMSPMRARRVTGSGAVFVHAGGLHAQAGERLNRSTVVLSGFRLSVLSWCGEVAQLVEHTTENRSVDSSILSLATIYRFAFTDLARLSRRASASEIAVVPEIVPASAWSLRDASARSSSPVMS